MSKTPQKVRAPRQKPLSQARELAIVKEVARSSYRAVTTRLGVSRGKLWALVKRHKALYQKERGKRVDSPLPKRAKAGRVAPPCHCQFQGLCPWQTRKPRR